MIRLFAALLLAALLLAGCANVPPPRPTFPQLTYGHLGALTFEAASVEVVNEYQAPMMAPNVEHTAPLAPANAGLQWARDRIKATGRGGRTVRVIVRNGRIAESDLRKTQGLRGAFTTDQAQRYEATLEMVVEVRGERGFRDAFATATVERSTTVPETITLNDRDKVLFGLVEDLMKDLNAQLERNIREFLAAYLR